METNYEESYRRIMEYQNEEHLRNQKKIRWGIRCVILIPMIFLMLMFSMDSSKVVFLVLRQGWAEAAKRAHENGDDELLIPDVFEDEKFEDWTW